MTELTFGQAGEFFIENVLKKRRAAAAEHAASQLSTQPPEIAAKV